MWARLGDLWKPDQPRGVTAAGRLEAHWKLDEQDGRVAVDASGQGLNGRFIHEPKRVAGMAGRAALLIGSDDSIDFGQPTGLRLAGSMTISAWIKPTSFSRNDAAIVSSRNYSGTRSGYQLGTTRDRGPRDDRVEGDRRMWTTHRTLWHDPAGHRCLVSHRRSI